MARSQRTCLRQEANSTRKSTLKWADGVERFPRLAGEPFGHRGSPGFFSQVHRMAVKSPPRPHRAHLCSRPGSISSQQVENFPGVRGGESVLQSPLPESLEPGFSPPGRSQELVATWQWSVWTLHLDASPPREGTF